MYKRPFLSIIIPVYNVSKFIVRCLESIYNQWGYVECEVVIVDDESPDDSIKIAQEYLNDKEGYRIIRQTNKGLGGARNTGIRNAHGKYVWFVDSDDEIAPHAMEQIKIHGYNDDDVCVFAYRVKDRDKEHDIIHSSTEIKGVTGALICTKFLQNQAWCSLYKREYLLKNDIFFREHFLHEDGEFNMRAIPLAQKVSYYPIPICEYHNDNSTSIMHSIKIKNQTDLLLYMDTYEDCCKKYCLNEEQKAVMRNYVATSMGLFFFNAIILKDEYFQDFQRLVRNNRHRIYMFCKEKSVKTRIYTSIMLVFPYKFVYRFIYRNHN